MTIKCIAIDDEPPAINQIKDYITKIPFLSLEKTFFNGIEPINYLKENKTDLIFHETVLLLSPNYKSLYPSNNTLLLPSQNRSVCTCHVPSRHHRAPRSLRARRKHPLAGRSRSLRRKSRPCVERCSAPRHENRRSRLHRRVFAVLQRR